eukprot:7381193-Prymnesium_polylepis.1
MSEAKAREAALRELVEGMLTVPSPVGCAASLRRCTPHVSRTDDFGGFAQCDLDGGAELHHLAGDAVVIP